MGSSGPDDRSWMFAGRLLIAAALVGCSGSIGGGGSPPMAGTAGSGGAGASAPRGSGGAAGAGVADPGRVEIHRLNNAEYDATMRDLLGVASTPAPGFIPDEKLLGFDTIAAALGMTDAQYEQYFEAADALTEQTFANPALRARILTCTPASPADATCVRSIINQFGRRAWRRPLRDGEVDRLAKVAAEAGTIGEDAVGAVKQVVKTMLASPPFLYRIELDPSPQSTESHPVDSYGMASRLSYLVWGTMPDEALFDAAAADRLRDDAGLARELDRLLDSPRANAFVTSFAGQWLGFRALAGHQVEATAFPDWDEPLRKAMIDEGLRYFRDFFDGDRKLSEFFTADQNYVDARLARHYGFSAPSATGLSRVTDAGDHRVGFLGLAAFLTTTSFSYRTSPTLRGKWVLETLLCEHLPPPPPSIPDLDDAGSADMAAQTQNVRARLEQHRVDPGCAGCHKILDPIGLGLEAFDGIGRHRTKYANGDAVDSSGMLPDGSAFSSVEQLAAILANDERLGNCASERLMTYVLSRELAGSDAPHLERVRAKWKSSAGNLRSLLEELVMSEPFRHRRGEVER